MHTSSFFGCCADSERARVLSRLMTSRPRTYYCGEERQRVRAAGLRRAHHRARLGRARCDHAGRRDDPVPCGPRCPQRIPGRPQPSLCRHVPRLQRAWLPRRRVRPRLQAVVEAPRAPSAAWESVCELPRQARRSRAAEHVQLDVHDAAPRQGLLLAATQLGQSLPMLWAPWVLLGT